MNREQQMVLSLLKEVDEICRKHEIKYYLSPELTLCGAVGHPFPKDPMAGKIWMKISDMEKFRQVMEAEPIPERVVESMRNNGRFPEFYLHYVNTKTLCYRLGYGDDFKHPGFCVQIYPLRAKHKNWKKQRMVLFLEKGWRELGYQYKKETSKKRFLSGCAVRLLSIFGKKQSGKMLYEQLCKKLDVKDTTGYTLTRERKKMVFPAEIFENTQEMVIEGNSFMVPGDVDAYLQKRYGNSYETKEPEVYTASANIMLSTLVSYEEYFRETGSCKKLLRARKKMYKMDASVRKISEYWKWCWKYVNLCASARRVDAAYREKAESIRNLMECRNYARLEQEFRNYGDKIKQFLKMDLIGVEEGEILEMYLEYLEKTGQKEQKARIERCLTKREV